MRFSWAMGPSGVAVGAALVEALVLLVMIGEPGFFADLFAVTITGLMVAAAGENVIRFVHTDLAIGAFALFVVTLVLFAGVVAIGAQYKQNPSEQTLIAAQYVLMGVSAIPSEIAGRFMRGSIGAAT